MKIGLCQLNPLTGDIEGNKKKVLQELQRSKSEACELLVFPELFLQGYPPRDLLENKWFIEEALNAVQEICKESEKYLDTGILLGVAIPDNLKNGRGLYNSAVLIYQGKIIFHQNKTLLPTYDIFDESRYFDPSPNVSLIDFRGEKLGITICEDAWNDEEMWTRPRYDNNPVKDLAEAGATLLINISASPFHISKQELRYSIIKNHSKKHSLPFVFVNMTGANDELVFDGNSMYFNKDGELCGIMPPFREDVLFVDTNAIMASVQKPQFDTISNVKDALVIGVRDYLKKCGFKRAVLGLSGGIDSAVTCAIAVEALGADNVFGITMPSQYSSEGSISDSEKLAENLGIRCETLPIKDIFNEMTSTLKPVFEGTKPNVAEENLQARIRGTLLMGFSNKFNALLLTTGNKSEMAVGYCTLYGDMNGGLAVISDLYKTKVYELARFINKDREIIPVDTITKPPSAELRPDQKDEDSLPPYEVLDAILKMLIEENASSHDVIKKGYDTATVSWIVRALAINEYKRRQSAPGLKVTSKAFGSGRRFPIAARYLR